MVRNWFHILSIEFHSLGRFDSSSAAYLLLSIIISNGFIKGISTQALHEVQAKTSS